MTCRGGAEQTGWVDKDMQRGLELSVDREKCHNPRNGWLYWRLPVILRTIRPRRGKRGCLGRVRVSGRSEVALRVVLSVKKSSLRVFGHGG